MKIADEELVKYLCGEASEAERLRVQQWLAIGDNKKHFARIQQLWEESGRITTPPVVDENAAWQRFVARTQQPRRVPVAGRWMKVAAALLLLAGGGALAYRMLHQEAPVVIARTEPAPVNRVYTPLPEKAIEPPTEAAPEKPVAQPVEMPVIKLRKTNHRIAGAKSPEAGNLGYHAVAAEEHRRTSDFICNATPCPLEICIIQNIKCEDGGYTSVSTCSLLEPDESGRLRYRALDRVAKNCVATIDEIRIRQVSTGETIILNEDSKTTAQDFFRYITGQKKGDVLAGMFHTNCDNQSDDCGLLFDNNYGKLILH